MKKLILVALLGSCTLLMADGASLYTKCAACHGKDGKTKALGKSSTIAGKDVAEIVKSLNEYKAGTLNQYGMGVTMKGQVMSYSPDDIKTISEYINKLPK